jgi:cell division protein FtsB
MIENNHTLQIPLLIMAAALVALIVWVGYLLGRLKQAALSKTAIEAKYAKVESKVNVLSLQALQCPQPYPGFKYC